MRLPVRRNRPEGVARGREDFDALRQRFAEQLDHWPDVFRSIDAAVRDVLPAADIEETDDAYLVDVELPGVKRGDVSAECVSGKLVVTGERRTRDRVGLLRHRTRSTGRFRFEVTLPAEIDPDNITASLDSGVLTLVVPKLAAARRRHIPVSIGARRT